MWVIKHPRNRNDVETGIGHAAFHNVITHGRQHLTYILQPHGGLIRLRSVDENLHLSRTKMPYVACKAAPEHYRNVYPSLPEGRVNVAAVGRNHCERHIFV